MKITMERIFVCLLSCTLGACGGDSSSPMNPDMNLDNLSDDMPNTQGGENPPSVTSIIYATDDIRTGGYVGSTGGLRSSITLPDDATGQLLGVVKREHHSRNHFSVSAHFGSFRVPEAYFEYMSDYARPLDSCQDVSGGFNYFPGFGEKLNQNGLGFEHMSAGEVLPLLGPSGTVGSLTDSSGDGFHYHHDDGNLPRNGNYEMQIDIPGDAFPGFGTLTIPIADELTSFRALNGEDIFGMGVDSEIFNPARTPTLLWDASTDTNTYLQLEFNAVIPDAEGTDEEASISLHCTLQDDGEFTFPPQVIALYPRQPKLGSLDFAARISVTQIIQPGVTLLIADVHEVD